MFIFTLFFPKSFSQTKQEQAAFLVPLKQFSQNLKNVFYYTKTYLFYF